MCQKCNCFMLQFHAILVLTKGQQFMFLIWHLPCYSCIHSSPVKVLAVIEDPPCYELLDPMT
jgi:hypothetical protein